jgi:hypothetical protein
MFYYVLNILCKCQEIIPERIHFQGFFNDIIEVEKHSYLAEWKLDKYLNIWQHLNPSILLN